MFKREYRPYPNKSHVIIGLALLWLVNLAFHRQYGVSEIQRINPRRSWGTDVCGFPQPINYSEPHGCLLQSPVDPSLKAVGVVEPYSQCNYFTENFVRAYCGVEKETHEVVRRLVTPSDVVMEVGARQGELQGGRNCHQKNMELLRIHRTSFLLREMQLLLIE